MFVTKTGDWNKFFHWEHDLVVLCTTKSDSAADHNGQIGAYQYSITTKYSRLCVLRITGWIQSRLCISRIMGGVLRCQQVVYSQPSMVQYTHQVHKVVSFTAHIITRRQRLFIQIRDARQDKGCTLNHFVLMSKYIPRKCSNNLKTCVNVYNIKIVTCLSKNNFISKHKCYYKLQYLLSNIMKNTI